jgi:hypothetical protein
MNMQKVIRHKNFVLIVISEQANCVTVANQKGQLGVWYPKSQKLVFRRSNGKMASI